MKTRNRRRDKSFGTEVFCPRDANLCEPCLIPSQLLVDIEVGRVILILMCESMGDMIEGVQIGRLCPPGLEAVKIGAFRSVWICQWCCRPEINPGTDRFLEFEWGVDLVRIFDGADSACYPGLVDVLGILDVVSITLYSDPAVTYLDIPITVVANLHSIVAACR